MFLLDAGMDSFFEVWSSSGCCSVVVSLGKGAEEASAESREGSIRPLGKLSDGIRHEH